MDGSQSAGLSTSSARPRRRGVRRTLLLVALLAIIAVVASYGYHWWTTGRFLEATDDAYTQADAVPIAPRVAGTVSEVLVTTISGFARGRFWRGSIRATSARHSTRRGLTRIRRRPRSAASMRASSCRAQP